MLMFALTSLPPDKNEIYVERKQQYVLSRKYRWAYKSNFIHLQPIGRNKSMKMTDSDTGSSN